MQKCEKRYNKSKKEGKTVIQIEIHKYVHNERKNEYTRRNEKKSGSDGFRCLVLCLSRSLYDTDIYYLIFCESEEQVSCCGFAAV